VPQRLRRLRTLKYAAKIRSIFEAVVMLINSRCLIEASLQPGAWREAAQTNKLLIATSASPRNLTTVKNQHDHDALYAVDHLSSCCRILNFDFQCPRNQSIFHAADTAPLQLYRSALSDTPQTPLESGFGLILIITAGGEEVCAFGSSEGFHEIFDRLPKTLERTGDGPS
jgi:hypothetical protein